MFRKKIDSQGSYKEEHMGSLARECPGMPNGIKHLTSNHGSKGGTLIIRYIIACQTLFAWTNL